MAAKMSKARQKAREAYERRMKRGREKEQPQYKNTSIFLSDMDDVNYWWAKEGPHFFDIIMYKAGSNDPDCDKGERTYVFEPFIHRKVGPEKMDVICLKKTYDKPCPICERVSELLDEGIDWNDIDYKVQKNPRSIYNVVVRDNAKTEKEGVQVAHFSHFTMEQHLLDLAEEVEIDESGGDPIVVNRTFYFDPEEGKKIYFKRKGKGEKDTEYLGHQFKERGYKIGKDLEDAAHCLDELVHIPTYDEAKAILLGEDVEEGEEPENDDTGTEEEVVEETEEEVVEETDLRDELDEMDKKELRKYIKDNKLDVKIKQGMEMDDIVDAIMEEVEGEEKEEKEEGGGEEDCPGGGTFGDDLDELSFCEECPKKTWDACVAKDAEENE